MQRTILELIAEIDGADIPSEEDPPRSPPPSPPVVSSDRVFFDRDYQKDAVERVFAEWKASRSTLVVMATGCGKTVVASRVAGRVLGGEVGPPRVLFCVHKFELVRQAVDTFRAAFPDKIIEVDQGESAASLRADIVVCTVQTTSRKDRIERFPPDHFGCVMVDECHHASGESVTYQALLSRFVAAKVLGLTATPDRADELALGQTFDTVAFTFDILDAVNEGWLVPVGQRLERCDGIDFAKIKVSASGEFVEDDLAKQMKKDGPLYKLRDTAIKYSNFGGKKRPTIVFAASRDHAVDVADLLNARDAADGTGRAAAIHYKLDKNLRREIVAEYKRGNIRYLTNYGILGEGFDDDETRVIINGRPCRGRSLYAQMFGRATRPLREILPALAAAPDAATRRAIIKASRKPGALLVDLMGLNHKLVLTMADVLGGRHTDEVVSLVREKLAGGRADGQAVDVNAELEKAAREVKKRAEEAAAAAKRSGVDVRSRLVGRNVDPFDVFDVVAGREPGYMAGKLISQPQMDVLMKAGIPERELSDMTQWRASRLIKAVVERRQLGLCSFKVANILRRFGYDPNTSREEASKIIDSLKANGWRKPK